MTRMTSCSTALLALFFVSMEMSTHHFGVLAQDDMVVENEDEAKAREDKEAEAEKVAEQEVVAPDAVEEADVDPSQKAQQYMDSAAELSEKLTLLQKLLDAKGDNVDPELKEKMDGLKGSLSSLGFTMDNMKGDLAGVDASAITNELATACLAMSVHRAGARRLSTLEGLRRMASKDFKPEDGKNVEVIRQVAVCINEIGIDEVNDFKKGNAKALSKVLANKAKSPEGETQLLSFNAADWKVIQRSAAEISGSLSHKTEDGGSSLMGFGWLAAIPVLCAVLFLTKKFLDMNKEKKEQAEAKAAKAQKKQK